MTVGARNKEQASGVRVGGARGRAYAGESCCAWLLLLLLLLLLQIRRGRVAKAGWLVTLVGCRSVLLSNLARWWVGQEGGELERRSERRLQEPAPRRRSIHRLAVRWPTPVSHLPTLTLAMAVSLLKGDITKLTVVRLHPPCFSLSRSRDSWLGRPRRARLRAMTSALGARSSAGLVASCHLCLIPVPSRARADPSRL